MSRERADNLSLPEFLIVAALMAFAIYGIAVP